MNAVGKPPETAADRICLVGALLLAGYFLITSLWIASHRLFWFDEVITVMTTRLGSWQAIGNALFHDALESTPFGYVALARLFDGLFGPAEIGIRLPSALAMTAGMLLTYDGVRRLTDRLHGLIAMAVLTCSYLPYYGYEGRSYALYFLFAAAALWAWIGQRSAFLLAAIFLGGMLLHSYFLLCLIPLVAEEIYNWRLWRRPSGRVVGAVLGAMAGLALLLPQFLAAKRAWGGEFWAAPVGRRVPSTYTDIFPAGLFLLAMAILWVALNSRSGTVAVTPISDAERTGWFALALPVAGYVLAKLVTHAYVDRYFIGLLPGVAVGFSCFVWRGFRTIPRIPVGILVLLAGYGVAVQTSDALHPGQIEAFGPTQQRTKAILAMEDQIWSTGSHYIVIDYQDHLFLEARYYSKHPERYVWWAVLGHSPRSFPSYPMRIWTLDEVSQHAGEAVFVDLAPDKQEALQRAGIRTAVRKSLWFSLTWPEALAASVPGR